MKSYGSGDRMELEVLFEDNHLLVLHKPGGLLTQDSGAGRDNLEDRARAWIKAREHKPGAAYCHVVHRLDAPVSGIVLCAKSSKALRRLHAAQRAGEGSKVYHALVEGRPEPEAGRLVQEWRHRSHRAEIRDTPFDASKQVALRYRVLQQKAGLSLLEIELETGRYHQIRAQLASKGWPIVGDHVYGSTQSFAQGCIALHHARLALPHPIGGRWMEWSCPNAALLAGV
jgi:23S rRNA pseudouridine1911/1915/1917 synthase